LVVKAEIVLREAGHVHPSVSPGIARTEAQSLDNVSLGFFGATDENLVLSN
jgi:hypothetical protein